MVRSILVGAAIFIGAAIGAAPIASAEAPSIGAPRSSCGGGYYKNIDNDCVESPDQNPGPSNKDGTHDHSEHPPGSGSHHGGTGKSKR
jgi:hypothetical protein